MGGHGGGSVLGGSQPGQEGWRGWGRCPAFAAAGSFARGQSHLLVRSDVVTVVG